MNETPLPQNLARLRQRNSRLADALVTARPHSIRVCTARSGAKTLESNGVLLASDRDPRREATRVATEIAELRPDLVVFIGFGIGLQVDRLRELYPCPIAIVEPDIKRLRAALALETTFPWLADPDVHVISLPSEVKKSVDTYYATGLRIHIVVHPSTRHAHPEAVQETVRAIGNAKTAIDLTLATRMNRSIEWTAQCISNAPRYLALPSTGRLQQRFAGMPAVIASAGPSLDAQLPALAEATDRVLTIAVGPSLGALRRAGIEPDLVHVLESTDVTHQLTRSGATDSLNLVLTPKAFHGLYEIPTRSTFIAYTAGERIAHWAHSTLYENDLMDAAPSVAMQAVWIAAQLGANPILLIGQDLAFTGGRVYAKGSCYEQIEIEQSQPGEFAYTHMEARIAAYGGSAEKLAEVTTQRKVWVPGWDGQPVATCTAYATFREGYARMGSELANRGTTLMNCTEGGARIDGIEHRPFRETLAGFTAHGRDPKTEIRQEFDAFHPKPLCDLAKPIAQQRSKLRNLLSAAKHANRFLARISRSPQASSPPERWEPLLKRLRRLQKKLESELEHVSWIDPFIQNELHRTLPLLHRIERAQPTPENVIEECSALCAAAKLGAERGLSALAAFETLLETNADLGDPTRLP